MVEPEELEVPAEKAVLAEKADIVNLAGRIMDKLAQVAMAGTAAVRALVVLEDLVCHLPMLMFMVENYIAEAEIRDYREILEEAEEMEDLTEEDMLVELMA
ncbi:MAG: hypothetical protein DBX53_08150 [Clostridiales bacterium]|nr:MAG: hypothetical protein DBX53_08150 [Clostridiales bacterium]